MLLTRFMVTGLRFELDRRRDEDRLIFLVIKIEPFIVIHSYPVYCVLRCMTENDQSMTFSTALRKCFLLHYWYTVSGASKQMNSMSLLLTTSG